LKAFTQKNPLNATYFQDKIKDFIKELGKALTQEQLFDLSGLNLGFRYLNFLHDSTVRAMTRNVKFEIQKPLSQLFFKSFNFYRADYASSLLHLIIPFFSLSESNDSQKYLVISPPSLFSILVGGLYSSQAYNIENFGKLMNENITNLFLLFPELLNQDDKNQNLYSCLSKKSRITTQR
jgi:hypothetical protein